MKIALACMLHRFYFFNLQYQFHGLIKYDSGISIWWTYKIYLFKILNHTSLYRWNIIKCKYGTFVKKVQSMVGGGQTWTSKQTSLKKLYTKPNGFVTWEILPPYDDNQ